MIIAFKQRGPCSFFCQLGSPVIFALTQGQGVPGQVMSAAHGTKPRGAWLAIGASSSKAAASQPIMDENGSGGAWPGQERKNDPALRSGLKPRG